MKVEDIRKGKKVFLVHSIGEQSRLDEVIVSGIEKESICGDPSIFAIYSQESTFRPGETFDSSFSLRDMNIIPNRYNNHKAFLTPSAAYKFLAKALKAPYQAPEPMFDYLMPEHSWCPA